MEVGRDEIVNIVENTIEEDETTTGVFPDSKRQKAMSKRSWIWEHYETLPLDFDKIPREKCKYCGQIYQNRSENGTGTFTRHYKKCTMRDTRDVGQMIIEKSKNMVSCRSEFNPEKFRELLVEAIILHDLPFQFVEYEGIRAVLNYLRPGIHIISRNTAKADTLSIYEREKLRTKIMVATCPGRISLTSDCWSSIITDGYISLTCHFIDKDWILHKRILNFSFMPPPHNGETLSEKIYDMCCDWGIEKNLFGLTLDNASSNDNCVDKLITRLNENNVLLANGKFFHLRCCAHIINLVVQDGLKDIDSAVVKIRDSIKFVKGSSARKQKWISCVLMDSSCKTKKGLRQDVPTRWNSTYQMLESALCYRKAFEHLAFVERSYKHCPSNDEWEKVNNICGFLTVFYEVTNLLSGTTYPTANLYFLQVANCYVVLREKADEDNDYIKNMARQMLPKFEKYWSEFSMILSIAVVFDPRYKLQFVDYIYNQIYGYCNSISYQDVKKNLFELFSRYSKGGSISNQVSSSKSVRVDTLTNPNNDIPTRKEKSKLFKNFSAFGGNSVQPKSQLELYLEEPRLNLEENSDLDVLAHWKSYQYRYPEVAAMARDILSVPVTTVASEAAFSVGGRVLDQYRTQLLPSTVEAIVCTRDWLFAEKDKPCEELAEDIASELTTEAGTQNSNNMIMLSNQDAN